MSQHFFIPIRTTNTFRQKYFDWGNDTLYCRASFDGLDDISCPMDCLESEWHIDPSVGAPYSFCPATNSPSDSCLKWLHYFFLPVIVDAYGRKGLNRLLLWIVTITSAIGTLGVHWCHPDSSAPAFGLHQS